MYFTSDKEKSFHDYPILTSDIDCIVHFFSLDVVKGCNFDVALFCAFPDAYESLYRSSFDNKLSSGLILPYRDCKPLILHIPFKNKYSDPCNKRMLDEGLHKLELILSERDEFSHIKKIGIQIDLIHKNEITESLNKINIPNVVFFEKRLIKNIK